jgi:hypothetical protein
MRTVFRGLVRWWRLRRRVEIRVGERVDLVSVFRAARLIDAKQAVAHEWKRADAWAVDEAREIRSQRLGAQREKAERQARLEADDVALWRER